MNTPKNQTQRITLASLILGSTLMLGACSDSTAPTSNEAPQSQADSANTPAEAAPDVYENILGQITMLPIANDPSTELKIHHQQIVNFKTKDGTINVNSKGVSGMPSMTMPFPTADGLSLDGLAVGDKIAFTFQVNWSGTGPAWEVTKIEKVDPATEIDFSNKIEELIDDAKDAMNTTMDSMKDQMKDQMKDKAGHDGP